MCNAHNHHSSFNCGWGGGSNSSFSSSGCSSNSYNSYFWEQKFVPLYDHFADYRAEFPKWFKSWDIHGKDYFVNPCAKCPVCGERVFFYANKYGARVFFDALGKPWPKHPCTDTTNTCSRQYQKQGYAPSIHKDLDDYVNDNILILAGGFGVVYIN